MNEILENLMGLDKMSDQIIATDLLVAAKSAIRNYSIALTETTSQNVRKALRTQLGDAIAAHETLTNYMIKKGYYHAYDLNEQYHVDMKATKTALDLVQQ